MRTLKLLIPANEDILPVESEKQNSLSPDVLLLGSWNCYSLRDDNLPKAIKYCLRSGNAVVALQDTKHYFSKVDNSKFEIIGVEREKREKRKKLDAAEEPEENYNIKLDSDYGMAFFVRKNVGISEVRVVSLHPRIAYIEFKFNGVAICLVSIYAPSAGGKNSKEIAKKFFGILEQKNLKLRKNFAGYLILCGDMNACPKFSETGIHYPWIDKHVYGSSNIHGEAFLKFLHSTNLHVLNSRFPRDKEEMWTYRQLNGKEPEECNSTEIDFFLSENLDDIEEACVVPKIDGERMNDHRMISSVWRVSKERETRRKKLIKMKISWQEWRENMEKKKLSDSEKKEAIEEKLNDLKNNMNTSNVVSLNTLKKKEKDDERNEQDEQEFDLLKVFNWIDDQQSFVREKPSIQESAITEEEVCSEFLKLEHYSFRKIDEWNVNANGVALLTVSEITNLFNAEFEKHYSLSLRDASTDDVPDWRKVTLHTPLHTANYKSAEEYTCQGPRALLGRLYSNILARRFNYKLAKHTTDDWYYTEADKIELQREEKRTEKILAITLLFEKFKGNNKPIYVLFVRFKNAADTVKVSSVLKSLKEADISDHLINAVASLLVDNAGNITKINENRGIHLGDVASYLLLSAVLKMVVNECNIKIESTGEKHTKVIPSENQIVLIDSDIKNLKVNFGKLVKKSKLHGLDVDFSEIVLIKNSSKGHSNAFTYTTHKKKFHYTIKTIDQPSIRYVNYFNRFIDIYDHLKFELLIKNYLVKTELRSDVLPTDKEEREGFFTNRVVPVFFYACETWKPTAEEFLQIEEYVQNFKKVLEIETYAFNTKNYILYKSANFLNQLQKREKTTYCSELLSMKSSSKRRWGDEIRSNFKYFMKQKFKSTSKLSTRRLIEVINNNQGVWLEFLEKCKENIKIPSAGDKNA